MIYGGTKYNRELRDWGMFRIVSELTKQRKTVQIPAATVDPIALALKAKFPEAEFDDEHIVALVIASRCRVVCTNDNPAISYLDGPMYSPTIKVSSVQIFRGHKDHKKLCCDKHVVAICRA